MLAAATASNGPCHPNGHHTCQPKKSARFPITPTTAAVTAAEATHYTPVVARALLVHGRAQIALERDGAQLSLARSVQLAIEGGDDATAIEAFARLLFVTAQGDRVDGLTLIEPLATVDRA